MPDFSTILTSIVQNTANAAPGYRDMQQQLAQTEDTKAQAKGRELDNFQKRMDQEQQKKFQDFQARMAALAKPEDLPDPKNPDSVGTYLEKQGAEYVKGGFINEGSKIIEEGIKMKSLGENAKRAAAQDTLMQLKIRAEKNEGAAASLFGVTDQAGMDKALKGTDLEGMKYTGPESVQIARGRLLDIKQQDKEKEDRARDIDRGQQQKVREDRAKEQVRHNKAIEEERRRADATKAGKTQKNSAAAPTKQEADDAERLIINAYPGMKDNKDSLATAGRVVAADAKRRMLANPALSWDKAAYQAMHERANSFKDIGKATQFVGGGDSADEALPLPKNVIEDRDPTALVKDKYYEFPQKDGSTRVGRWTGTGIVWEDDTPPEEEAGDGKSEWDDESMIGDE
jgi:hypothetical protein